MSAIGYVNKSIFLVPISLIEIECIFAYFTVTSYQTFVINARTISFFPMGRSEIKHVPDKRSPYERSFSQSFPVLHVIECLVVFRMPISGSNTRLDGVLLVINTCSGTIFTDSYFLVRKFLMSLVQKGSHIRWMTSIPTKILVPGN